MKTLTCAQLGGPCETAISGNTADEMMNVGMEHVKAAHPEMVAGITNMTPEQGETWNKEFQAKFATAPETK